MNWKIILIFIVMLASAGAASATFVPNEGNFAFREVENYTLHDINFTVPTDYKLQDSGDDFLTFKHDKDKLKINVLKNGTVKKVNSTKKIKSGTTMLGSTKGYLVDENSTKYTFSYKQDDYLVVIKSKDLSLIMGVMGKD